jgi:hypothetical protein
MRDITTAPIFIRLGKRQRAPEGTPVAKVRRIVIDNVVVSGAHHEYASIIAGLAESAIEDVRLSNIRIHYNGGGTKPDAERAIPENEKNYPEPSMFGVTPAYGFYVRHVRGITFDNVEVSFEKDDLRPAFFLEDVSNVAFFRTNAEVLPTAKMFVLNNVSDFSSSQIRNREDVKIAKVERREF